MDSAFFKTHGKYEKDECTRTFAYVGRFLFGFAQVESRVDDAIAKLLDLETLPWVLTVSLLDLRKKLQIIQFGCKRQNQQTGWLFGPVNELHDVRNTLVHSRFIPDYG